MAAESDIPEGTHAEELARLARQISSMPPGSAAREERDLYRSMKQRVWLYGFRHLRDTAAADDLVQQVMMTTIEHLRAGRVREPERIASFVLGACRNMVRDLRRGERRRRGLLGRYGVRSETVETEIPTDLERLEKCLRSLSHKEQAVVRMTFYAESSSEEIARELTLAASHIRVIRHRALARLRNCMTAPQQATP